MYRQLTELGVIWRTPLEQDSLPTIFGQCPQTRVPDLIWKLWMPDLSVTFDVVPCTCFPHSCHPRDNWVLCSSCMGGPCCPRQTSREQSCCPHSIFSPYSEIKLTCTPEAASVRAVSILLTGCTRPRVSSLLSFLCPHRLLAYQPHGKGRLHSLSFPRENHYYL